MIRTISLVPSVEVHARKLTGRALDAPTSHVVFECTVRVLRFGASPFKTYVRYAPCATLRALYDSLHFLADVGRANHALFPRHWQPT